MIHHLLEIAGVALGMSVTAALFALNIVSLFLGRRIFRSHSSCQLKMM